MILKVIASGSSGNAYVLDNGKDVLLLEAGVNIKEIKQAIDYQINRVCGCLVTHAHTDHAKSIREVVKCGINTYSSRGTHEAVKTDGMYAAINVSDRKVFRTGSYQVMPFIVEHDAPEPFGYLIVDEVSKERLLFVTDTHMLRYRFKKVDHYLIECNYDEETISQNLQNGFVDTFRYNRILESHMGLKTLVEAIKSHTGKPKTITLIHLSDSNCNEKRITETIINEFGLIPYVADAGVTIGL